jgi:hypothetical protein
MTFTSGTSDKAHRRKKFHRTMPFGPRMALLPFQGKHDERANQPDPCDCPRGALKARRGKNEDCFRTAIRQALKLISSLIKV